MKLQMNVRTRMSPQKNMVSGGVYEHADDPCMVKIPKRNFQTNVTFEQPYKGQTTITRKVIDE